MNGKNICVVTGQYPPQVGGVGHSAYRIVNLMAAHGLNVQVVAFQKHPVPLPFDESVTSTQEGKVLVHRVKVFYPNRSNAEGNSDAEILTRYNREMFHALDHFHRVYQYDLFHAFFLYPAGYVAGLVGCLHHVKTLASIRGNDVGKYAFDPLRLPFIRSALENADFVTSVATNLLDLADRAVAPIKGKKKTILNSINLTGLPPTMKPELELKGLVIGTSGLFRYKKGLLYLFKALANLKGQFPFTILLLGDFFNEEDRRIHKQYLKDYGLEECTVITGKIQPDRMAEYLQAFDVLVYPSLFSEGCPLSMLEGMAMNKPVIGARSGAIPEIIHDRENGLLVNPGSAEELTRAIVELKENPELRARLAENGSKTVQELNAARESREWINVYKSLGISVRE